MRRAFLGLVLSVLAATGCPSSSSKCEKAIDNVIAKCQTCLAGSSSSSSSRDSASCRQALLNMCGSAGSSSSSSSSSNPDAFLNCVANATSCDGILLCR